MSKILDLAKNFEQTSNEQVKNTEQTVATEFKKHEQRLIDLLNENEKAISNAIQEQNKRLLPIILKTWSYVAIAVITALVLVWGILVYQSHKISKNMDVIAQQQATIQQLKDAGGNLVMTNCIDDKNRKRTCIQMNTQAGSWKGGYLVPMGYWLMTELEKHLLEALEQAQAQQQRREINLIRMFESTKQDNHSVKEAFKSLLADISEADQSRNANLSKLVRLVNNLSDQLEDFKTQNTSLTKQLQVLETQVTKLKK